MTWGVGNYNQNPNFNNLINGIDIGEGSDAGGYNDALRQIVADIATWVATGLDTLGGLSVAFRDLQIVTKTAAFTFADAERAKAINYTGSTNIAATLNPQSSTTITPGAVFVLRNGSV